MLRRFFSNLDFRQQLILTFSIGISCLAVVSSLVISSISSKTVYDQLLQQGKNIVRSFSEQSTLALLYHSPENAQEAALATLAFPDIAGVAIFTSDKNLLYKTDSLASLPLLTQSSWSEKKQEYTEDHQNWYFWAPVMASNSSSIYDEENQSLFEEETNQELVGFVYIVKTKKTLNSMTRQILHSNLITSVGLALLLLFLLLTITKRVTKPLKNLAAIMGRARQGEIGVRAELSGPKDIIDMKNAFNTMMSVLESREDELKRARDTALASARVKGEFAATVSHELRTPMNGVMGMLELLQGMGLTEKQEEYIKVARNSGEALLVLIDEILDFSKIESGKMRIIPGNFDPREMLDDISGLLKTQARQKNLNIRVDVSDDVPQKIRGDSGRIRQILINLIGNALKFTHEGGITLSLALISDDNKQKLRFEVQDTGIGIPKDAQQRIFEAFAQVDSSTTRKYGGTGLGLAICYQLIALMGGKLSVNSTIGKGSTFWFTLPLEEPLEDDSSSPAAPVRVSDLRALIVSSDSDNCRSLVQSLNTWEIFQRNVTGGQEALERLKLSRAQGKLYDIIIIDNPIEEISSSQLVEKILCDPVLNKIKLILLGFEEECKNHLSNCLENKKDIYFLPKLPDTAELFKVISQPSINKSTQDSLTIHQREKTDSTNDNDSTLNSMNILVVEDNIANQMVARGMLERLGQKIQIASDGKRALDILDENSFDIIFMDCLMPGLDGYDTTKAIRHQRKMDIPIIAMTANVGPNDRQRCLDSGMNDYISKPLNLKDLKSVLLRWANTEEVGEQTLTDQTAEEKVESCAAVVEKIIIEESVDTTLDPVLAEALAAVSLIEKELLGEPLEKELSDFDDLPTLDKEAIVSLKEKTGRRFQNIINAFFKSIPKYIQSLNRAAKALDATQVYELSHCIRGAALNLGAKKLVHLCTQLEEMGKLRKMENAPNLVNLINNEYFYLKKALEEFSEIPPDVEVDSMISNLSSEEKSCLLIVDDDKSSRDTLCALIDSREYRIIQANDGVQALSICKSEYPNVVLMDAMMPNMDGFEACKKIQNLELPNIPPVLMITALQDEKSIEKAFMSGASDFVPKPINQTVLRQRLKRLLKSNRSEQHMHKLVHYDMLTNLPNRNLFLERGQKVIQHAEKNAQLASVIFIDLDRFNLINDTQGYDAGDLLLKTVALRLQSCVRSADLIARLGGDDFIILLDNPQSIESIAKVSEKICRTLRQPFSFNEKQVYISASLGVAMFPQNGGNISALMKHADTAMFRAKAKGGSNFQFYEYGMETEITRQLELESELRQSIDKEELVLYYQPLIDINTEQVAGVEALIRWQHPQRGLLPPSDFIPLAEESGMIKQLGEWVFREACMQQRNWIDSGFSTFPVAINISAHQLEHDDFITNLNMILNETKISPQQLKLEITENTLSNSSQYQLDHLHSLKELGVLLSIDDFGSGYSSLTQLKRFPIESLKIDPSLIGNLDDKDIAITVSSMIALGHRLGIKLIAEGVETEEQVNFLREKHCDIAQGYLLCRPLPADSLEVWFHEQITQ